MMIATMNFCIVFRDSFHFTPKYIPVTKGILLNKIKDIILRIIQKVINLLLIEGVKI